jgi:hypothetical protein
MRKSLTCRITQVRSIVLNQCRLSEQSLILAIVNCSFTSVETNPVSGWRGPFLCTSNIRMPLYPLTLHLHGATIWTTQATYARLLGSSQTTLTTGSTNQLLITDQTILCRVTRGNNPTVQRHTTFAAPTLICSDRDVSRECIANYLRRQGYSIYIALRQR